MATGLKTMSNKELTRLEIIQKIIGKQLTQVKASELLNLSIRQVGRLD